MSHIRTPEPRQHPDWLESVKAALIATAVVSHRAARVRVAHGHLED
ncbi:hypothetical protein [Kocuria rhizophila]|nr:hypothetical protein [Kocuria rhizophila]